MPAEFPPEVLEAAAAAASAPQLPDADLTDLPFVTVDPPGSTDLDQAMHLERRGDGYRVDYAIADVPAFVAAGGPVDAEARRRGQTLYAPDQRTPAAPAVAQRGRGQPAAGAGPAGLRLAVRPRRRRRGRRTATSSARSSAAVDRLDYGAGAGGRGRVPEGARPATSVALQAVLLREIGDAADGAGGGARRREPAAARAGGRRLDGRPLRSPCVPPCPRRGLERAALPADRHGGGADSCSAAGVGVLRTLPAPGRTPSSTASAGRRRRSGWRGRRGVARLVPARLRRGRAGELALMHEAGALFRGAGYAPLLPGSPRRR